MKYQFRKYSYHYIRLFVIGLPVVIGQVGNIIMGFADTLMIGRYGTNELAAASFVNSIFNLVIIASMGFTYGLTPLLGVLAGKKKGKEAGELVKNSLLANMIVTLLLVVGMELFYEFLDDLGQPVELLPIMKSYYLILLGSFPFVMCFNTFKQFADGVLDTRTSMWILISGNLLNILGNYLLIYGKFGFPELGLNGAGCATAAARFYMAFMGCCLFVGRKRYHVYWEGFRKGFIRKKLLSKLNRMGWPVFFQMGMETASFSLSSIMVGWIGVAALAAHQVMLSVSQVGYMIYYGMSAAVAIRVSHFKGRGDWASLRNTASAGFHLNLLLAILTCVPVFLLRDTIGGWFTDSSDVIYLVSQTMLPFLIYQFGDGLQCNYANALRGIGDVQPMIRYAFIAYFVVSLPLGFLFGIVWKLGLVGVWFAFPFGLTLAGILYYIRFRKSIVQMRNLGQSATKYVQ